MTARRGQKAGKRRYRQGARARAAEQTRADILDAAARCFAGEPYDVVSLERIAGIAAVTVQSVLRIFGSKGGLFEAAAARAMAQMGGAVGQKAGAGDPRAAIEAQCRMYEKWGDATHRVLAQEERVEAIRTVAERGRAHHRRWVRALFEARLKGPGRAQRLAVLTSLLDLESYRRLRREGLGPRAASAALCAAALDLAR